MVMAKPAQMLDKRVLKLWWLSGAIFVAVITAPAFILWLGLKLPALPIFGVLSLIVLFAIVQPPIRYRRWSYEIRQSDLYISRGFIAIAYVVIPFDRIQYVETRQGPLDRMFGLANLVVHTAAAHPGKVPGLPAEEAERLREELSKVAGTASV